MPSIYNQITTAAAWEDFLAWRLCKNKLRWRDFLAADEFIATGKFLESVNSIVTQDGLHIPSRRLLNKMGSSKKRVVYCYEYNEMEVLKLIAHLLYKYDSIFASNCYSFRRAKTVHSSILNLKNRLKNKQLWAYKTDIHDYFNSISIPILLPILKNALTDEPKLYEFFESMLTNTLVREGEDIVTDQHGIMAGTPTASFLANLYLSEMDRYFEKEGILYARYSDDIIVFAEDQETLQEYISTLKGFITKYQLSINPSKEHVYSPSEPFEFLGYKCDGNSIGLSDATVAKMKGKISRKARSVNRWRSIKKKSPDQAMERLIGHFNNKFFGDELDPDTLNWSRWYFPVINDISGFKTIDHYLQEKIRYAATGRNNNANYRIDYAYLKSKGYKSLVGEYYKFRSLNSQQP